MRDFDIEALSLAVPPVAAPVTTYRPAVRVRNNGIHPANVTGYLRMYRREPPGDLLASWPISLQALPAGDEGNALAEGYWTPLAADIGREFLFTAHVDTDNDQNPSNNDLSPVTVLVTSGEAPPEPIVTNHATQHENGGTDELHVDGLAGELADAQPPKDHANRHEGGGADEMNVAGLHGVLADGQPTAVHGNEAHAPYYATATDISNAVSTHNDKASDAHTQAQNLEHTTRRGAANGYAPLDSYSLVPAVNLAYGTPSSEVYVCGDHTYKVPKTKLTDFIVDAGHVSDTDEHILLTTDFDIPPDGTTYIIRLVAKVTDPSPANVLTVRLKAGPALGTLTTIADLDITIDQGTTEKFAIMNLSAQQLSGTLIAGGAVVDDWSPSTRTRIPTLTGASGVYPRRLQLSVQLALAGTDIEIWTAEMHRLTP